MRLAFVAFCVQLVFLVSVFDIHFRSPVLHNLPSHNALDYASFLLPSLENVRAPAKRLVLFSVDGLRADACFDFLNKSPSSFLKFVQAELGVSGMSHARMPTESRPGHVAMVSGLYEDPSAVFKGWKENPVDFDTIFNQSRFTWAWGSPDILPMFAKGSTGNHVFIDVYSAEDEKFFSEDASKLDSWVFDHFESFLKTAPKNATLRNMLQRDQVVFFLHLLGMDTNGHSNKPYSTACAENLKLVDQGVQRVYHLVNDFYGDNETAFVLTSDHGMTDWGSHGAGDPSETETPLFTWGAGVIKPKVFQMNTSVVQVEIQQADLAPFMASLIGIGIPANSVGLLPVNIIEQKLWAALASLSNLHQLLSLFEALQQKQVLHTTSWRFKPFEPLSTARVENRLGTIKTALVREDYDWAIRESNSLMRDCLTGADYYYRYDRFYLKSALTLAFFGWMTVLATLCLKPLQNRITSSRKRKMPYSSQNGHYLVYALTMFISAAVLLNLAVEGASVLYYIYYLLPIALWCYVGLHYSLWILAFEMARKQQRLPHVTGLIVAVLIGTQLLVNAFFQRWYLSIGLVAMGLWPFVSFRSGFLSTNLKLAWAASCSLLAVFPALPVIGQLSHPIILYGCGISAVSILWLLLKHLDNVQSISSARLLVACLVLLLKYVLSITDHDLIVVILRCISWCTLGFFVWPALNGSNRLIARYYEVCLGLLPAFMLMSLAYEPLFLVLLVVVGRVWIEIEYSLSGKKTALKKLTIDAVTFNRDEVNLEDFRRGFIYLFLIITSFFGLGNIASVNSFDPQSVRSFVATFSPFVMGALMLWKILVPFLVTATSYRTLTLAIQARVSNLIPVTLIFSTIMGLRFFHWIKTEGSWLDIGMSLSHFIIVQLTVLFLLALHYVTSLVVRPLK